MNAQSVAVFDGDAPTAVAFTRSLGRRGVDVRVYSPHRYPAAGVSRYCAGIRRCPPLDAPGEFLPWLEQQLRAGLITCVAPTSDQVAWYLSELEDMLPAALRNVLPAAAATRTALFKDHFHAALDRLHFPAPLTRFPMDSRAAAAAAQEMQFPLVVKPRSHVAAGLARGTLVHNTAQLADAFVPCTVDASNRLALGRYPLLARPMLQQYVPGALEHLYSISGIISPMGELLATAGSRKTAQWPPTLGVGVRFEPWLDRKTIAMGARLAREILGRGLFELELIWDARQGRFLAIDLNPRAYGQMSLDVARGNDLPWLWFQMYSGESVAAQPGPRDDVTWRHAVPFHAGHLARVAQGPDRGGALLAWVDGMLERPSVDVVLDARDVLPGLVHTARMLGHPGGLVRPFLD